MRFRHVPHLAGFVKFTCGRGLSTNFAPRTLPSLRRRRISLAVVDRRSRLSYEPGMSLLREFRRGLAAAKPLYIEPCLPSSKEAALKAKTIDEICGP
jgi:hypothetical protein